MGRVAECTTPSTPPERAGKPQRHHGNRHGRSEDARRAVLEAADDLLAEKGFAGVTVEGIAAAAGVAKQTIYRWWSSKTDILLDTFLEDAARLAPRDHGDLATDLRAHLRRLADFLSRDDAGTVLKALIGHAQHDPAFAAVLRERYLDEQRRRDRLPLDRAVERGELPSEFDVPAGVDLLVGPIYHRALITGDPLDDAFVDGVVGSFIAGTAAR